MKISKGDIESLLPQIAKERVYLEYVKKEVEQKVNNVKEEILKEFNNHPVTIEIEQGIYASNISGTLNGITNLYSFIGFEAGEKPIEPIRSELEKIGIKRLVSPNGSIIYKIDFPDAKDIFNVTPLPWAIGRSWAKGIETGISGLGFYIKQSRESRSGLGIQSKTQVRSGLRFKNTRYISAIIKKYGEEINKLNKLIL